jgi:penicillin-binding protein activator
MNRLNKIMLGLVFVMIGLNSGCASGPKVERMDSSTTVDVSGQWNDTDSRLVAEEMITDCLGRPWVDSFRARNRQQAPSVIVGAVKNRSHEHINVQTFVKNLERALINSGRVEFVASKGEREQIRSEREDQARNSSDESMKGPGQEQGADFMLIGTINTIRDEVKGTAVMYYQVNLELVSLANNVKAWIGEKQIKKLITRPKVKW